MAEFIIGAVLIPEKLIFRQPTLRVPETHYVKFSADTIYKVWKKFHENGYEKNVNINHEAKNTSGIELVNSFILDNDNRHTLPNELNDLPDGSWMAKYRITNVDIWNMIQQKELNGFSIEGVFDLVETVE